MNEFKAFLRKILKHAPRFFLAYVIGLILIAFLGSIDGFEELNDGFFLVFGLWMFGFPASYLFFVYFPDKSFDTPKPGVTDMGPYKKIIDKVMERYPGYHGMVDETKAAIRWVPEYATHKLMELMQAEIAQGGELCRQSLKDFNDRLGIMTDKQFDYNFIRYVFDAELKKAVKNDALDPEVWQALKEKAKSQGLETHLNNPDISQNINRWLDNWHFDNTIFGGRPR